MENAGWTLKKCKEYEKEQIDKCFPENEMPGNDAAFDHSECRNPEELSKKIVSIFRNYILKHIDACDVAYSANQIIV